MNIIFQPLEQFNQFLNWFFFCWIGFNFFNSTIVSYLLVLSLTIGIITLVKTTKVKMSIWGVGIVLIYYFILSLFERHITSKHAHRFFPLIFTTFVFVLWMNLFGLLPYSFTLTSHIFVTLTLSLIIFVGIILLACQYNKLDYFSFFIPKNVTNLYLKVFLIFIEIISYIIRPFSLSIRLFANMLAGHTLLYILNSFITFIFTKRMIAIWFVPFVIIFFIFVLECCIAFIQAFVYATLVCIYINDIYNIVH